MKKDSASATVGLYEFEVDTFSYLIGKIVKCGQVLSFYDDV